MSKHAIFGAQPVTRDGLLTKTLRICQSLPERSARRSFRIATGQQAVGRQGNTREQPFSSNGSLVAVNVRRSIAVTHSMALTTPALLQGIDLHYETENRVLRNEQERRNEERELVYEISWIPELSTWRRFLRSQRSTLRDLRIAEVARMDLTVKDGKVLACLPAIFSLLVFDKK